MQPGYHAPVVRYREIQPAPSIREFVQSIWTLEHDGLDLTAQRIVPDGRAELILNWGEPFAALQNDGAWQGQPHAFLAGQLDGPLLLRPRGPARILGIRFHPHGASRVLAPPMHELTGTFTPIDDISPNLSRDLEHALYQPDPTATIESALVKADQCRRQTLDQTSAEAVRRITHSKGTLDVAVLARDLGLSLRQFERRFLSSVGLSPKFFCRIQRFNNVFRLLDDPTKDWVETALASGYYDQAHLIRDCKSLSGTTPAALFAEGADLARHFYLRNKRRMSHSSNTRVQPLR